jgi:predicted dienelactone hydrolase
MSGTMPWSRIALAQDLPAPQIETWPDAARSREIAVLLRWPAGKPVGVMVYSHGLGGKKEGGDVWGKAWAQAGLLVVHLQHPGSDARSLKGGFSALREANKPEQLIARTHDMRFAIAEINRRQAAGGSTWAGVPVQKMAVGGHSMGARTAMLTAGWQRTDNTGAHPQPKAFVAMSPAINAAGDLRQARKELAGVTRPFLVCSGSLDGEIMSNGETPESRRMVFDALPGGKKALLWLSGADHFTFAGNDKQIPSTFLVRRAKSTLEQEDAHHETVARISAAWLREQLLGQPMAVSPQRGAGDEWLRA